MIEINWIQIVVTSIIGSVIVIAIGSRQSANVLANDLVLSLRKAHLGKRPKGQYDGQYVYAKKLTREQLCVPLNETTLRSMAECTVVDRHEITCRVVRSKVGFKRGTITLSVSVHFRGRKADGEQVSVHVSNALLMAAIETDKTHSWTLVSLQLVSA